MRKILLFSLIIILHLIFFNEVKAQEGTNWHSNGPYGGDVKCVSVSKSNPNIVYLGTDKGVYKSENKGASWYKTGLPDIEVISIKASSLSPNLVFAGTYEEGLWETTNGGIDWIFEGPNGNTINCITSDPNAPNTFYFGGGGLAKSQDDDWSGVFYTADGGETFHTLFDWVNWNDNYMYQVNDIFIDPDSSNHIYVVGQSQDYGAFLYSSNYGKTWKNKEIKSSSDNIQKLAVVKDSSGNNTAYVLLDEGLFTTDLVLYKTTDLGDNWEKVSNPYNSNYVAQTFMNDPNNPNTIYIGTSSLDYPLLTYKADKDKWGYITGEGLVTAYSTCIDISTGSNPEIYLGSTYGGIYNFTTGTSSKWTRIVKGIDEAYVNDIAVVSSSPDAAYTCIKDEYGLFLTTDDGSNWSWIKHSLPEIIAVDPNDPLTLYAAERLQYADNYVIYKSMNGGFNWLKLKYASCSGGDCYTVVSDILINPANTQDVLVATDFWWTNNGPLGFGDVFRTTNGGGRWDKLLSVTSSALAIDPNNPDIVYSGKQKAGQIWKVENVWGAENATEITPSGGIDNITGIEVDNSSNVYVLTASGLMKYSGGNWTKLSFPYGDITSFAIDREITTNMIYAGTNGKGVYVSTDRGSTWTIWNAGLKNLTITKLKVCGSKVWAGTAYGGVWCRNTTQSVSLPYLTSNTGDFKISIFQDGSFGHLSSSPSLGIGCMYKSNVDALCTSGLIFGTKPADYVNGDQASLGIVNDFTNIEPIHTLTSTDPEEDFISKTAYNDSGAVIPYGVSVSQEAFSKSDDEFVILKFGFTPSSSLKDFYAGIFADWDIGGSKGAFRNLGGYDKARNLAYQYISDKSPDPNYYGIVALSGLAGAKIATDDYSYAWPVRETALQRISTFKNETIVDTGDYRMWIGSGPYNITQGDTKFVYFAFVAGTDLANLQSNADAAAEKYQHLITGIKDKKVLPKKFSLSQNYPNPFNPVTTIRYQIPKSSLVTIKIFDILGREVKELVDKKEQPGIYKVKFDGSKLSSSVYFYRIQAGSYVDTKKMILLK